MTAEPFVKRGHPTAGYGYKADRRHLLGLAPSRDAASLLSSVPVPTVNGGIDDASVISLGILDQGGAPFCVSHGWAGSLRLCELRNGLATPRLGSRLWLMYLMHAIENDVDGFDGAIVEHGAEVVERMGFPPEDVWPYSDSNPGPFSTKPPADAVRQAYDRIAPFDYGRIMTLGETRVDDVMRALSAGGKGGKPAPVVFGTNVSNAFAANNLGPNFLVGPPGSDVDGGHCMYISRFELDPGVIGGVKFRVVNSWSQGWGDNGMCWMEPAWLMDPSTDDLWLVDHQGVQP
jgi:hypothetical protein